jgi:hypothetical protein
MRDKIGNCIQPSMVSRSVLADFRNQLSHMLYFISRIKRIIFHIVFRVYSWLSFSF